MLYLRAFQSGHFDWTCVNLLIGAGDAYSTDVALAFESAAIKNGIDVCTKATYQAGSTDMTAPIKEIMDNSCCLVTVLFAQTQDISSLLLEAHKQHYEGEWIMSENVIATLEGVVADLKRHMEETAVHKLLRGMACIYLQKKVGVSA